MKAMVQRVYANHTFLKATKWAKLITVTGAAQAFIQVLGLLCGILIIRLLPATEYALYTIANTMFGTMIMLADGGLTASVMARSGKAWNNKETLSNVLSTGFYLRKRLAVISLLVAIPILLFLLHHHGANWIVSGILTLALIPPFFSTLYGHLLEIIPKLRQDIVPLQKIQASNNIIRLLTLVPAMLLFPFAWIAIVVTGISQVWANIKLYKLSAGFVKLNQPPDKIIREEILSFVRLSFPNAIYFSISGQIMIWLVSVFGSTKAIAEVGAIGRLGMILLVFSTVFSILVSPRFSKLAGDSKILLYRYLQIQFALIALSAIITSLVIIFPDAMLWILGNQYSNLKLELILGVIGSCLNLIVTVTMNVYESRGWVIRPALSISLNILTVILGIVLLDIKTIKGIFLFNIFQGVINVVIHFLFGLTMIFKQHRQLNKIS